ncbi:MAG TPA: DUF3300 domain-containing protein [Candidatus Methylacidiphilales bacterium]|nr:DUF3300 domain-containing protein [Candidatus Methylacidiphilales bacterium]
MKLYPFAVFLAAVMLFLAPCDLSAPAQTAPVSSDTPSGPVQLTDADLQQLVAPIALYPDPMLALILQASTVPSDIVLANRWLNNGGSEDDIDAQTWDDSVKGLARYPDVLQMMDENLDWTNQLGAAVLAQQADVMRAVQEMRAKAQAQGNLETTAQQQVITQGSTIEIVPANPQVIYVPTYDPTVIYYQPSPPIVFGTGLALGIWIGGGCNWNNGYFYRGGCYRPGYGWGYTNITINNNNNVWRPPPNRPPPRPPYRPGKPGHIPGWRPPPNGGRPPGGGRPGNPGTRPPGSKPRPPINGPGQPGNRPGQPGNRPQRPGQPGIPENRPGQPGNPGKPGQPGNRPGGGNPSIQPHPNPGGGNSGKPGTRPNRPTNPGGGPSTQPVKPQPKPAPSRPSAQPRPSPKPPPSNNFDRNRPSSKPHPSQPSRPSAQPRPAPSQGGGSRGGGGGGGGNRGGGGGGGGGNRGGGGPGNR